MRRFSFNDSVVSPMLLIITCSLLWAVSFLSPSLSYAASTHRIMRVLALACALAVALVVVSALDPISDADVR